MQLLMSFLELPPEDRPPAVWTALDAEGRAEVVATLARLMAKTSNLQQKLSAPAKETSDE